VHLSPRIISTTFWMGTTPICRLEVCSKQGKSRTNKSTWCHHRIWMWWHCWDWTWTRMLLRSSPWGPWRGRSLFGQPGRFCDPPCRDLLFLCVCCRGGM